jgi:hypothetical protein
VNAQAYDYQMMRFTANLQVVGWRVANFEILEANVGVVVEAYQHIPPANRQPLTVDDGKVPGAFLNTIFMPASPLRSNKTFSR